MNATAGWRGAAGRAAGILAAAPGRLLLCGVLCLALCAAAAADVVHLKSGGRIEGRVTGEEGGFLLVETRIGPQRIPKAQVARVERVETDEERLLAQRARLAAEDVAGRVELARRARELRMPEVADELLAEALILEPGHDEANALAGRVRYQGRFVTPQERDRLESEARRAEMAAQGLVEHQGRFVTPEEKEKLEQGLTLRDGEWLSEDEAKRRDGFVKVDGAWVHGADHEVEVQLAQLLELTDREFAVEKQPHVAVYSDAGPEFARDLAALLEKGFRVFQKDLGVDESLEWLGGRRVDVMVFRVRFDYEKFADALGASTDLGAGWAQAARRAEGVFVYDSRPLAMTYVANRGLPLATSHSANLLGHVLLNSYRNEHSTLPPFLDDAYAALLEFELTQRNAIFSIGREHYEKLGGQDDAGIFLDGRWIDALQAGVKHRSDTPLEHLVRRDYGETVPLDVAKGMALYRRWRAAGDGRIRTFFDALRDRWPRPCPTPKGVPALTALRHAFMAADRQPIEIVDRELREFILEEID